MPAQSSLEGLAKLMAAKAMVGGAVGKVKDFATGDARAEKRLKKRQAKEKLEKAKKRLKEEDAAHAEWLRENGSYIQAIKDRFWNSRKILSAEKQGWADGDKRREEERKQQKLDARIRRAETVAGMSRADLASQLAYEDNAEREKEIAERKALHERETEQRHSALADELKNKGEFKGLEKSHIIDLIKRDEQAKELNEIKAAQIEKEEQYLGGMETLSPTIGSPNIGPDSIPADIGPANFSSENIVSAIEKVDDTLSTKDSPSVTPVPIGTDSAPIVQAIGELNQYLRQILEEKKEESKPGFLMSGEEIFDRNNPTMDTSGPGMSMEAMLDGDPLPTQSDQFEELLKIEREELDFDRRREAREIKAARLALEASRDAAFAKDKKAGPSLLKKDPLEKGGFFKTLGNMALTLGKIGLGLTGMGTATGLLTSSVTSLKNSVGNFASKFLPKWLNNKLNLGGPGTGGVPKPGAPTVKGDPAGTTRNKAGRLIDAKTKRWVKPTTPGAPALQPTAAAPTNVKAVTDASKATSKTLQTTKNVANKTSKVLGRVALPLTAALSAFEVYSTETDESLDRTEKNIAHTKTGGGLAGAAAGATAGAIAGSVVPIIGTAIGGLIGGGLGYFLGSEVSETVAEQVSDKTNLSEEKRSELDPKQKAALIKQAEDMDVVDTGLGHGTIKDLEGLAKLNVDTLQSLLDQETWAQDDLANIENLILAKQAGQAVSFKDGGFWGDDSLEFGEVGTAQKQVASQAGDLDPGTQAALDAQNYGKPQYRGRGIKERVERMQEIQQRDAVPEAKPTTMEDQTSMWDKFTDSVTGWFGPDIASADKMAHTTTLMAEQATSPGSIFTHDIHLQQTLWDIWKEQKPLISEKVESNISVEGEKESPLGDRLIEGDSAEFTPQLDMFGNKQDLVAPVPVIDVSPTAPAMQTGALIPSELLAEVISQISAIEKQPGAGSAPGATMVNTNTNIDNSVRSNNLPNSTAFAPAAAMPSGIGRGA